MKGISASAFTLGDFSDVPLRARLAWLLDSRPELRDVRLADHLDQAVRS